LFIRPLAGYRIRRHHGDDHDQQNYAYGKQLLDHRGTFGVNHTSMRRPSVTDQRSFLAGKAEKLEGKNSQWPDGFPRTPVFCGIAGFDLSGFFAGAALSV
jgi:hypothetical protein